jgi:hypothetical protein
MTRVFGGGEQWQAAMTEQWIARLMRNDDGVCVAVLDGQVRPSVVKAHLERLGARSWRIVLADCGHAERNARLREGPGGGVRRCVRRRHHRFRIAALSLGEPVPHASRGAAK